MATRAETTLMVRRGEKWRPMSVQPYGNEDELQQLLHETPSLLPGVSPSAIAGRELEVPDVGFVDLMVIDVDGSITLVECKLRSNSQIRREVVGQILAYASGLWRMPYLEFEGRFARASGAAIDTIAAVSDVAGDEERDETVPANVAEALAAGRFRLCIAVDEITDELRDIVEFLNTHSSEGIEVVLFEVGIVTDGDVQVLVPRTFGGESARLKETSAGPKRRWTFADVVIEVERVSGPEAAASVQRIESFFSHVGWPGYPGKGAVPTWSLYSRIGGVGKALVTIYPWESGKYGRCVAFNLGSLIGLVPDERLAAVIADLGSVPALASYFVGIAPLDGSANPLLLPLAAIADATATDALINSLRTHIVEGVADPIPAESHG
jgi:hypothetical protein